MANSESRSDLLFMCVANSLGLAACRRSQMGMRVLLLLAFFAWIQVNLIHFRRILLQIPRESLA